MQVGDMVVVRERGIGTLEQADGDAFVVRADAELTWTVPRVEGDLVRPLIDKQGAATLIDRLTAGDVPPVGDKTVGARSVLYRGALERHDIEELTLLLGAMYAQDELSYAEKEHIPAFEKLVFAELGKATKKAKKKLRADIRLAALGEPYPAELRFPSRTRALKAAVLPKGLPGEVLGKIFVEGTLCVGEFGGDYAAEGPKNCVGGPALAGVWVVWTTFDADAEYDDDDANDDDASDGALFAAHVDHLGELEALDNQATERGEVPIDGARMSVIDGEFAKDDAFMDDLLDEVWGVVKGRGATIGIGGDGYGEVWATARDGQLVYARIDLY
jgi:hypothetical protein